MLRSVLPLTTTLTRYSRRNLRVVAGAASVLPLSPSSLCIRSYRGDSGEGEQKLSPKEQVLADSAIPRSKAIMDRHVRFPKLEDIPESSFGPTREGDLELQVRKKRLIYRSKQRGWLEVDLLLGTWANENVPSLSMTELDEFESFVNMETIDIYNIVTLKMDLPDELKTDGGNSVVERIQEWAKGHPLGKADPVMYETVKADNNLI